MLLGIDFTVTSELIKGRSTPNLYGLLFVTGMIIGYYVIRKMFQKEGVEEKKLDALLLYVVPATIVGARLGHVFFYDWSYYKNHLSDIPKVWEGGLASHGAAIVILIMLYVYSKRVSKQPMLWILDRIAAPIAIAGCFIRLGNLVNQEIVGIPTDLPWGFRFSELAFQQEYLVDGKNVFRHPTQIYEAFMYLLSFIILYRMYWKTKAKEASGKIFGMFMILIWTARFVIEFVKEGQSDFDAQAHFLNTGQLLSIPFILIGVYLVFRKQRQLPQATDHPVSSPETTA